MSRVSPRTYIPLDCRVFDDDKIIEAGERAAFLYLNILCAIKLDGADGTITRLKISRLHVDKWQQRVDKLVSVGLLLKLDDLDSDQQTYLIPSWSRWNLLQHEVDKRRANARIAAETRWNRHAGRMRGASAKKDKINKDTENGISHISESVDNFLDRRGDFS